MGQWMDALLIVVPFFTVALLGKRVVAWCTSHGLVANHDDRRSHTTPTPHGGGVVLVVLGVPLGLWAVWAFQLPYGWFLTVLLLASVMVAVVGFLDDKHEISARWRLAVHLLAVAVGIGFLPPMFDFMPLWLDKLILLLAWGWFVNLFNFMDGADGLASSEAAFMTLAVALFVPVFKPLALPLAGLSLGFLTVNWQPAKVFLGDVGSTWLGYVLGGLLLVACADDTWTLAWPLFTCTLVFTADATYTLLIQRLAQGHKPWIPHREFWFHRVLRLGYSHAQLAWRVAALNLLLLVIAIIGWAADAGIFTLLAGMLAVAVVAWRITSMEGVVYGKR
ncbi:MAG: hypothetical protein H6922_05230 [Pseudomonadaceae bacterium]|nr:hypothetical protein [Pseudomonadaceae bacterium]